MSTITDYLQSIEDRIDAINTCALLEEVAEEIQAELQKLLDDIKAQTADLTAMAVPPVDLATTIVWITAQINAIKKSIVAMIEETVLITEKITAITAKLQNKIATLGCSFTPPTIP